MTDHATEAVVEPHPFARMARIFTFISFAGLAAVLRSGQELSARAVLSATIGSAVFGLGVAVAWCTRYGGGEHLGFVGAVSSLAGVGCSSLLDSVLHAVRRRR